MRRHNTCLSHNVTQHTCITVILYYDTDTYYSFIIIILHYDGMAQYLFSP